MSGLVPSMAYIRLLIILLFDEVFGIVIFRLVQYCSGGNRIGDWVAIVEYAGTVGAKDEAKKAKSEAKEAKG